MEKVQIIRGIAMPFYPMRPAQGRVLRNSASVNQLLQDMKSGTWVVQPKMHGDRACLGVLNGKVYIQNRHGSWLRHKVKNADVFKKLPNATVLDGEVFEGKFYPFETLAVAGKNMTMATCMEREVLAMKLCQFLEIEWRFAKPSEKWLLNLRKNEPMFDGVVLKKAASPYIILGSADQVSLDWMKRRWM